MPMSLPKELKSLRYFCLLSFFFVLYMCLVVITECFVYNPPFSANWDNIQNFALAGLSTTLPTSVFAYLSHPNVLDIYRVFLCEKMSY